MAELLMPSPNGISVARTPTAGKNARDMRLETWDLGIGTWNLELET
jgi:hypothetical protein